MLLFVWQLKGAADNQAHSADIADELVDDTGLSEEVNGTPEGPSGYSVYDEEHKDKQDEDDDGKNEEDNEEEEVQHPGEVSIGKKIWTFITT